MNSVLDSIGSIAALQKDTASKSIAKELMKAYEEKHIPNIKNLANSCFVAQSSITKFAKQIGYDGYRELATKLKMEIHDRKDIYKNESHDSADHYEIVEQLMIDAIFNFRKWKTSIEEIARKILKAERIFIFSSYILFAEAKNLEDILLVKNKNVVFSQTMIYNLKIYKEISKKDFVFFLVSGQDTKTLELIYSNLNYDEVSHCAILSHSKSYKFNKTENKIIMDSPLLPHMPEFRKVLLNYIVLQIASNL